jgi:hypothetical protein
MVRADLRNRRRAMLKRSVIVLTLVGCFCGSAFVMRANSPTMLAEAKRVSPANFDPLTTGSIAAASHACRASTEEPGGRAGWTNARACAAPDDRVR